MTAGGGLGCSLGVMQGRLSPMIFGGYQAFPADVWEREFVLAEERGLEHIEWVLDAPSLAINPILKHPDVVRSCVQETNVSVISVCADFLMERPLDVTTGASWEVMEQLLASMIQLDAMWVVIPCVDQSSITEEGARRRLAQALHRLDDVLNGTDICIALETDLAPMEFSNLLSDLNPDRFGVNYDIGNSASLGFSPREELESYGARVNLLHVKDRSLSGGSVPLGTGEANLPFVLETLLDLGFDGPVTLQCFRDHDGVAVFDEQLAYYCCLLKELHGGS